MANKNILFIIAMALAAAAIAGPVTEYGRLVGGKPPPALITIPGKIVSSKNPQQTVQLKGPSLHWSSGISGSEKFFNAAAVNGLVDGWGATVIRAPLGIDFAPHNVSGGYLTQPSVNWQRVKAVADAAIEKDVYVIVDWHSHTAHDPKIIRDGKNEKQLAIEFFTDNNLAGQYCNRDNVIFEIFNEPLCNTNINGTQFNVTWQDVKSYADEVIAAIRNNGCENLILVGTTHYSGNMKAAASNPPNDSKNNYALVFHFYAGNNKVNGGVWDGDGTTYSAMITGTLNAGIPVFVSEWGTYNPASTEGDMSPPDTTEARKWINLMDDNKLSSCVWAATAENGNTQAYFRNENSPYNNNGQNDLANWTNTSKMTLHGKFIYEWMRGSATTLSSSSAAVSSSSSVAQSSSSSSLSSSSSSEPPSRILSEKNLHLEIGSPTVVEIYNLKGNKVASYSVLGTEKTIKVSLPSGVYIAKARGMQSVKLVLK